MTHLDDHLLGEEESTDREDGGRPILRACAFVDRAGREVFDTFILPQMMARAARGEMSPRDAVVDAENRIRPIYQRWRERGLVGGTR